MVSEKRHLLGVNRSKAKPENQARSRKRKLAVSAKSHSKRAKTAYGPEAIQVTDDVSPQDLVKKIDLYLKEQPTLTHNDIGKLELQTRNQSTCGVWLTEHSKQLTSSNFGAIMSRKAETNIPDMDYPWKVPLSKSTS